MKKICRMISIVFLSISIFIIVIGFSIKANNDYYYENKINKSIFIATKDIENENWDNALKEINDLEKTYIEVSENNKDSLNKNQMNKINDSLKNLKKAVNIGDKGISLAEIAEINNEWNNINKR